MNIQSIIITNCIGICVLIILLISSHFVRQRRQLPDKIFTALILITMFGCLNEMITYLLDGNNFPGIRPLEFLTNTVLYFLNMAMSLLWCIYTDLKLYGNISRIKKRYFYVALPALVFSVLLIVNIPFQFVFSIDEKNIYHREMIGYLYYLPTVGYLIYSVILRYRYDRVIRRKAYYPIWMFLTPIIIGISVQIMVYGISLAWCSTSLGLAGLYMALQNELSYLDPLTKAYNRSFLELRMRDKAEKKLSFGGLMIDIDFFKEINDKFGHNVGDDALIDTVGILRLSLPDSTILVRYAGDEFILLSEYSTMEDLEDIMASIKENLEDFNDNYGRPYKLSFSMGAGIFDPDKDDADNFISRIDEKMYEDKKEHHTRMQK